MKFVVVLAVIALATAGLAQAQAPVAEAMKGKSIADLAVATPELSTLVAAAKAANLVEALAETEGITVFAPVNSAFEAALKQVNLTAAELLAQQGLVTDILLYHVVPAVARAADLVDGQILPTLGGQNITVSIKDGSVYLIPAGDSSVRAKVIAADIEGDNGVVHLIDTVLFPKLE